MNRIENAAAIAETLNKAADTLNDLQKLIREAEVLMGNESDETHAMGIQNIKGGIGLVFAALAPKASEWKSYAHNRAQQG